MKLGTQPVNTTGVSAIASGFPAVLPTNPNSPFAKLIIKSELGQIVQQWLLLQNKCTLGSASSCALRCQLPGIAPYHALLVMGSRQVFIRALAPKLARDGVMVNELLLTEDQCTFEIAGHQFELIRNVKTNEPSSSSKPSQGKLKFTLARPMEIGHFRQPPVITPQLPVPAHVPAHVPTQAIEQPQPRTETSPELQSQWITDLIQSAMLPLERQLHEVIEPLAAVQNELDKRSRLERKRRKLRAKRAIQETALSAQIDVQPPTAPIPEPVIVPIISPEVESQLARQSETLDNLNARLTEVKSNLGSLERVVSENFVTVIDAASAPVPTPEPVNEALQRITSVADQLKGLTTQLDDVKSNLGSLERIVSETLVSTNELRNAPVPASNEALQRLAEVANQLSLLLQDMNARQISTEDTDLAWREQLRTQIGELRDTVSATESSILKATEIRQTMLIETRPNSGALIAGDPLNATIELAPIEIQPEIQAAEAPVTVSLPIAEHFDSSDAFEDVAVPEVTAESYAFPVNEVVEEVAELPAQESKIEPELPQPELPQPELPASELPASELPANLFTQFSWNPGPAASVTGWEVAEWSSPTPELGFTDAAANFIEETIEEAPIAEEIASHPLPSWWTDDDKTQYKDDASPWKVPSNSNFDADASIELAREANFEMRDFTKDSATEVSHQSASAWDTKVNFETVEFNQEAEAVRDVAPQPAPLMTEVATQDKATGEEPLSEKSLSNDDSFELSSLLERFGIAREPVSGKSTASGDERRPMTKPLNKAIADELPNQDFAALVLPSEQNEARVIDELEVVEVSQEPIAEPEPVPASPEGGEEESIEDYMKRLMARMRGGSLEEESKPSPPPTAVSAPPAPQPSDSMPSAKIALPGSATERASSRTTGAFNPEEYVPKALAPEKARNMAAMRELANTSARSAIQVSARRRYGTAIALRLAISLTGFGVGVALVMINGLNVNIGLIATVASFLVALIWGFDAFTTLKPLLYSAVDTSEYAANPPKAEDIE